MRKRKKQDATLQPQTAGGEGSAGLEQEQQGAHTPAPGQPQPAHATQHTHEQPPAGQGADAETRQKSGRQQRAKPAQAKTQRDPVLPWMRVPILIEPGNGIPIHAVAGLNLRLRAALSGGAAAAQHDARKQHVHYTELFPVQSVVWSELAGGASTAHDLCIAAPTGSGKTLAYALPIVNGLARQQSARLHMLRALVVLPTRDLAVQVHSVFAQLCPAVGLALGLAAAQVSLPAEAQEIMRHRPHSCQREMGAWEAEDASAVGGQGCVDVLVATPGRLVAHLAHTSGFTLEHLRFLVVDETDRLLRQSYQEWLPHVLAQLHLPNHYTHAWRSAMALCAHAPPSTANPLLTSAAGLPTWSRTGSSDSLSGGWSAHTHQALGAPMPQGFPRPVKVVVSATLTRDPSKLQRLELHCPRYIATSAEDHRYHLPRSLQEFKVLCSGARKPLTLLALLQELRNETTIVFASSLEITHKLYLLLRQVWGGADCDRAEHEAVEFSSHLSSAQRATSLEQLRTGRAKVLVASDAMTRGMDVDNVQNIVNYDAPVYAKTYVHRAGRTARAGRSGRVFTLLRDEDVRHFKQMLRKADNTFVHNHKLAPGAVDAFKPALEAALGQVQELLEAEAQDDRVRQDRAAKDSGQPKYRRPKQKAREQEQQEQGHEGCQPSQPADSHDDAGVAAPHGPGPHAVAQESNGAGGSVVGGARKKRRKQEALGTSVEK